MYTFLATAFSSPQEASIVKGPPQGMGGNSAEKTPFSGYAARFVPWNETIVSPSLSPYILNGFPKGITAPSEKILLSFTAYFP